MRMNTLSIVGFAIIGSLLVAPAARAQCAPSAPWPGPGFVPSPDCQGWLPSNMAGAPPALTATIVKGPLVSPDYLSQDLQDIPVDATVQVVRLTPAEGVYQLLVVVRRPGETTAQLRFYRLGSVPEPPPAVTNTVTCPQGFVQTVTPWSCVPRR